MQGWLRRIRGAVGMGVTWALGWGVIGGAIMEGIVDPDGRILDMWPQTLAIPGFVAGVVFALLLWAAEGRRRFEDLSIARFGTLGGAVGLSLGGLALGAGLASGVFPLWLRAAVILGPVTVLSAASATGSLALARWAGRRESLPAGSGDGDPARPVARDGKRIGRAGESRGHDRALR